MSISTAGTVAISVAIISLFWIALRYIFITRELANCRAKIIEGLLNTEFVIELESLIESSVGTGNMWLEYNRHKIDIIKRACLEYIETAENRVILTAYSYITDKSMLTQIFRDVRIEIERIFKLSKDELVQKEIKDAMMDYSTVFDNEKCVNVLQDIFSRNANSGNLTNPNENEEGV